MSAIKILRANLKRLRLAKGLTQQAFAERIGMDYKFYQHLEAGRRLGVTLNTLEVLAKGLGVPVAELLEALRKQAP